MSTSILYIPASGDPHGVLADGLCGAKVPTAIEIEGNNGTISWKEGPISWWGLDNTIALPLVWRGEVVPEAEDRLQRRLYAATSIEGIEAQDRALAGEDAPHAVREVDGGARLWALAVEAVRVLGGRVEVVGE